MSQNRIILFVALGVFLLWLFTPTVLNLVIQDSSNASSEKGQFGDMYGFATSLFSGLTIVGLIYTILLQREDISISNQSLLKQQEEVEQTKIQIELNRNELVQTRAEFVQQNRTLKLQRFENTFFNMCSILNHIIGSLPGQRGAFDSSLKRIFHDLSHQPTITELSQAYTDKYEELKRIDQYCSVIEKVVDVVLKRKKTELGRNTYLEILYSQLSTVEKRFCKLP